jgi:hypothetical protein
MCRTEDLKVLSSMLKKEFPEKEFLEIHRGLTDAEKKANLILAESKIYDGLLFTASIDCGVSIDILGYALVFFRYNSRSIDADVVMQMCHRVRHLSEGLIVLSCDARVKDWERYPGYNHTRIETKKLPAFDRRNSLVIKGAKNITEALTVLLKHTTQVQTAHFYSKKAKWWIKFTKRDAPREVTLEETENILLYPPCINELFKDDSHIIKQSINDLLDECELIKILKRTEFEETCIRPRQAHDQDNPTETKPIQELTKRDHTNRTHTTGNSGTYDRTDRRRRRRDRTE